MKQTATKRTSSGSKRRKHPPLPAARRQDDSVLRPVPTAIAEWWKEELAKAQAEYLADTGEAMPTSIEEMKSAAHLAGFTSGEAVAGDYTFADVYEMALATRKKEQRQAAAVAEALRTIDPLLATDKYDRAIQAMSITAKKAVAGLLERRHTIEARSCLRRMAARYAGCAERKLKDVIEHEIRPIENSLGFTIIDSKRSVGYWLTLEGVEVAKRIAGHDAKNRGRFPLENR